MSRVISVAFLLATSSIAVAQNGLPADADQPQYTVSGSVYRQPVDPVGPQGPGPGPVTNAFTYQGMLEDAGQPANGQYDMRFVLLNDIGGVVAGPVCIDNVLVTEGVFSVNIDLGSVFTGEARRLRIEVRPGGVVGDCAGGSYTVLTPSQPLTATPYALGLRFPFLGVQDEPTGSVMSIINPTTVSSSSGIRGILGVPSVFGFIDSAGVRGESADPVGAGVLGISDEYVGVIGYTTGGAGSYGVFGRSDGDGGTGVWGWATAPNSIAVLGTVSDPGSWAGYFAGNTLVEDNLDVGGKTTTGTLRVTSNAGAGRTLVSDGAGNANWTATNTAFIAGSGVAPSATTQFLSPVATITISAGQKIHVTANQALGSSAAGGADSLDIYVGYRVAGSGAVPTTIGAGIFNLRVPQNTRHTFGISGIISGLAPGTYEVGMAGDDDGDGRWNNNEWGYVSVFTLN